MDLNKVQLIGRVATEPVKRTTANGTPVASLSLATNAKWKDGAGTIQEKATFHNLIFWAGLVKVLEFMHVGDKVYVEGRINIRQYLDKNTQEKRKAMEIVVENVILLTNKKPDANVAAVDTDEQALPEEGEEAV